MVNGGGARVVEPNELENIENGIRNICMTKGRRIHEFFLDFDKMRSGFVTRSQFFRVLYENIQMTFTEAEEALIYNRYRNLKDARLINWSQFCKTIDRKFDDSDYQGDPSQKTVDAKEYLGTNRSLRPLSPRSESLLEVILQRTVKYCQIHGMNVRDAYKDFDPHNIGRISQTHFFRNFPGPKEISEEELNLLLRKYSDPDHTGQMVYLNMHFDVLALTRRNEQDSLSQGGTKTAPGPFPDPSLNECRAVDLVLERCKVAAFKFGIRTTEFFRDFDKLRSGYVTESQFSSALSQALGREAQLKPADVTQLANFYRNEKTGMIHYKSLCDVLEAAFTISELDKRAQAQPERPPRGALGRNLADLATPAEEVAVRDVLSRVADEVRRKRILLYPYFKDFDRSKAFTGVMTRNQFARVLSMIGIDVSPEDVQLLARKFSDPVSGDVNYPSFIQVVEPDFQHSTVERDPYVPDCKPAQTTRPTTGPADLSLGASCPDPKNPKPTTVTAEELLARIRHVILTRRRRIGDFFTDFDPLRHGRITTAQFRRVLDSIGLSKLGEHDLNDEQFCLLLSLYGDPAAPREHVNWMAFARDIDSVFTQYGLEKTPSAQVPPAETFIVPPPGTVDWSAADSNHRRIYDDVIARLRLRIDQRRIDLLPAFEDYDKLRHGHCTRNNFRQVLAKLELPATIQELEAMEARWCNDVGFNYRGFLNDVVPQTESQLMYIKRLESLRQLQASRGNMPEKYVATDLEGVLFKIRSKVIRDRVMLADFVRDYDKLHSGRVKATNFRRALDLAGFNLGESELAIIEDRFRSGADPSQVDYVSFNHAVEAAFTPEPALEKKPHAAPEQMAVFPEWRLNALAPDDEALMLAVLDRLAEKIRKHRLQLYPPFEDFDRQHSGHVSKPQFRRCLTDLRLGDLVNDHEFGVLCQKFDTQLGGRDDVNYTAFCDVVYSLAGIHPRLP